MPRASMRRVVALVSDEREKGVRSMMKRAIIFALVLFGALAPVVGVAEAHWDTTSQCNEIEAP